MCGWKRLPFALRAAHEDVAEELHLDLLEAVAAATLAAAAAGVEGERARGQSLRHRFRRRGEEFADAIEDAEIERRRRARRARERRLIDHHHLVDAMRAGDRFARARFLLGRLRPCAEADSDRARRGRACFSGTGDAGDAGEDAERNVDVDVSQIVLARAGDRDRRG